MTTKESEKSVKEKLDDFLHEKNCLTDGLAFIEKKTGVNRLYICVGKNFETGLNFMCLLVGLRQVFTKA